MHGICYKHVTFVLPVGIISEALFKNITIHSYQPAGVDITGHIAGEPDTGTELHCP